MGVGLKMRLQNGLKIEQITLKLLNENNNNENITVLILKSFLKKILNNHIDCLFVRHRINRNHKGADRYSYLFSLFQAAAPPF